MRKQDLAPQSKQMKQVLRGKRGRGGGGGGATESDMERESARSSARAEEINYLSLRGLYGELQLAVVKTARKYVPGFPGAPSYQDLLGDSTGVRTFWGSGSESADV